MTHSSGCPNSHAGDEGCPSTPRSTRSVARAWRIWSPAAARTPRHFAEARRHRRSRGTERRRAEPGACALRIRRGDVCGHRRRSRPTARVGWVARCGRASPRCGSRCPIGRPLRPTSTCPWPHRARVPQLATDLRGLRIRRRPRFRVPWVAGWHHRPFAGARHKRPAVARLEHVVMAAQPVGLVEPRRFVRLQSILWSISSRVRRHPRRVHVGLRHNRAAAARPWGRDRDASRSRRHAASDDQLADRVAEGLTGARAGTVQSGDLTQLFTFDVSAPEGLDVGASRARNRGVRDFACSLLCPTFRPVRAPPSPRTHRTRSTPRCSICPLRYAGSAQLVDDWIERGADCADRPRPGRGNVRFHAPSASVNSRADRSRRMPRVRLLNTRCCLRT